MAFSLRTPRLLLREWRDDDRAPFARMSEDPAVMEMLLPMNRAASDAWITQMQAHCHKHGFCQWAVELPGEVSLMAKDGEAKQLVDASTGLSNFPFPQLAIDTALAAIPARYALDRGQWWEAAHLVVRDSQFPAAQSITYFARALGAARAGDLEAARAEIGHLDEIEAKLIAAKDEYWAGQTRIQKEAA